ncbi:MAG: hypothetical protein LAO09_03595 [Acidobacteriia bacterium]|nr:hypothetical protein [Terriglobia bacterium]
MTRFPVLCTLCCAAFFLAAADINAHAQTFSVLYDFGTHNGDPANPVASGLIAQGRDGNLYTTSPFGGTNDLGTVFRITPTGTLLVLHSFDATQGSPLSGLTLGTNGNFYGTTSNGGTSGVGTVFKVTPGGVLTVLHNFAGGSEGANPDAPPIQATDGNWYGTTTGGGAGGGTVYKMTPAGALTTLHSFNFADGYQPIAPLVQGTDDNLYGTTKQGGNSGARGVVYKITRAGMLTVLFNFDGTHGVAPVSPLFQARDGNFYGTTEGGGGIGGGVVFKITPAGKLTVLHDINGGSEGAEPDAGLVQASDQNLYGGNSSGDLANQGDLFRISLGGSYSVVHDFDASNGGEPDVTPFQHTNGILYGDARNGGSGNRGVFYSLDAALPAFVSFLPAAGKVGATIQFLGQGFTGTTAVSFNGTPAQFTVNSDTQVTATVPAGAKTGKIGIETKGGIAISAGTFTVTQ